MNRTLASQLNPRVLGLHAECGGTVWYYATASAGIRRCSKCGMNSHARWVDATGAQREPWSPETEEERAAADAAAARYDARAAEADHRAQEADRSATFPAGRCPDCGEPGERAGHQTCQYPGRFSDP